MDSKTLLQNIDFAKPLTANDITEINRLLEIDEYKEYSDVLSMMIKMRKKLEQEIIFQSVGVLTILKLRFSYI